MYIKVKVRAGAKAESFRQTRPDHFEISVRQKAERNMANERIIELIARHFHLSRGKIRLVNGHHSPSKMLSVDV